MKCWTCGRPVQGWCVDCGYCRNSKEIKALRNDIASYRTNSQHGSELATGIERLAVVQQDGFANLCGTLESGLAEIASAIEWGLEGIKWAIEQQTVVLQSIDHTLKTPSETQANEWRKMAEELRQRGVLNESAEFFLKALDINRLDFRIYVGLAQTYIQDGKFDEARTCLERSLPHAPHKEMNYKSYSLRLIGHIYECAEDYGSAASKLKEAIEWSPNYAEGHYDYAQYCARTGELRDCLTSLEKAILSTPLYWYIAKEENNFSPCKKETNDLLSRLYNDSMSELDHFIEITESNVVKARESYAVAGETRKRLKKGDLENVGPQTSASYLKEAESMLAESKLKRNSGDYDEFLKAKSSLEKSLATQMAIEHAEAELKKYQGIISERKKTRAMIFWGIVIYLLISGLIGAGYSHNPIKGFGYGVLWGVLIPLAILIFFSLDSAMQSD